MLQAGRGGGAKPHLFLTVLPEQQDSNGCCTTVFTVTQSTLGCCAQTVRRPGRHQAALFRASGRKVQLILRTSGTPSVLDRAQTAWMDVMAATLIDVKEYMHAEIYTSKEQSEFAARTVFKVMPWRKGLSVVM